MNKLYKPSTSQFLLLSLVFGILSQWLMIGTLSGISIPITITLFYLLYFFSMKNNNNTHFQMSLFVFICIILIAFSYLTFTNSGLINWSLLALPFLVAFHLVLFTSSNNVKWYKWSFVTHVLSFFGYSFHYLGRYMSVGKRSIKQNIKPESYSNLKMILLGLLISVPLLVIVSTLLISADEAFGRLLFEVPAWIFSLQWGEQFFRLIVGLFVGLMVFGFIQSLTQPRYRVRKAEGKSANTEWNGFLAATVLISLNVLYVLFLFVQFQYFFSGTVQAGLSYAEYARRGFFELISVTLINWTVFLSVISFVKTKALKLNYLIKALLSFMIISSGVMLLSAFIRLMLYEQEYGFTTTRFLVHSFMIFLCIVFIYSLVKVWIEKLSLARFYFLSAIVSFTVLHAIHMDEIIVHQNMQRYEETGKIDLYYLNSLSGTGTLALIDLYEKDPTIPKLEALLKNKKKYLNNTDFKWQEFNIVNNHARNQLEKLSFDK